ncbi:hypothetical protein I4U23_010330 [Adineta vaga]|nr:hypothetical protein I4U23_010330 [Adineta vaga]
MSVHEGVSCDACSKNNFRFKRFKCLICFDYDLCSTCYEQGNTSSQHTAEHPMQCILTRQDFDLYYHGEACSGEFSQSLTCPLCGEMGLAFPYIQDATTIEHNLQNSDLFQHLQIKHAENQQTQEVICPICASMINGDSNYITGDLLSHIANDHQHSQVTTPSSAGVGATNFLRQSLPSRDYDFGLGIRNGFRRGSSRILRGRTGLGGRGGNSFSPHFLIDTFSGSSTSTTNANDPICDLLSQLSNVRRLTSSNNNGTSTNTSLSSTLNTINLQSITRQQYDRERERLRAASRLHHSVQQPTSNRILSADEDIFDSFFSSTLNDQTWTHVIAPSQPTNEQQSQPSLLSKLPPPPPPPSSTTTDPDPSLLHRLLNESSSSSSSSSLKLTQSLKTKNDFVQNLLLSSFINPTNNQYTE